MVLPETDDDEAFDFCERIRKAISMESFTFDKQEIRITVSMGVAAVDPKYDVQAFIQAADHELYRAKRAGKNRTAAAGVEL